MSPADSTDAIPPVSISGIPKDGLISIAAEEGFLRVSSLHRAYCSVREVITSLGVPSLNIDCPSDHVSSASPFLPSLGIGLTW